MKSVEAPPEKDLAPSRRQRASRADREASRLDCACCDRRREGRRGQQAGARAGASGGGVGGATGGGGASAGQRHGLGCWCAQQRHRAALHDKMNSPDARSRRSTQCIRARRWPRVSRADPPPNSSSPCAASKQCRIVKGFLYMDAAVLKALGQWRYSPSCIRASPRPWST